MIGSIAFVAGLMFGAPDAERKVFATADGWVTVLSDGELAAAEAEEIAKRVIVAWDFDKKEDQWPDPKLLAAPLTVRVVTKAPDGLLGRANAPSTFLIALDYVRRPGSAATIAHELTHLQDFRVLKKAKLPQWWLEGRADSNAFAFRAHLGMQQNPDWKGRVAKWTSADARAVFVEAVQSADHRMQVEEVGTLWIEHLRVRYPDAHPRSARMIAAVAAGAALEQAFATAFGEPYEKAKEDFLAYLDRTQSDPDARVAGTWMQWTSNAGRVPRTSRAKAVNAVIDWREGKAYVFRDAGYARFDIKADKFDPSYPQPLSKWPSFPWPDGADAAVNWGNGKAYFFKGDQYTRYDFKAAKFDAGFPKRMIRETWPGFPWIDGFDTALNWGDGVVLFFKDKEYLRYNTKTDEVGAPQAIDAKSWPGLGFTTIDAAVSFGAKAYFFSGASYVRYDAAGRQADLGFPQPIDPRWKP
ncbi:MAG: hypothetical protein IT381_18910 [Deltaproteobacteria bacterium]|nr:hypothetical protein [Deltaproteobacteria bacterium]